MLVVLMTSSELEADQIGIPAFTEDLWKMILEQIDASSFHIFSLPAAWAAGASLPIEVDTDYGVLSKRWQIAARRITAAASSCVFQLHE